MSDGTAVCNPCAKRSAEYGWLPWGGLNCDNCLKRLYPDWYEKYQSSASTLNKEEN